MMNSAKLQTSHSGGNFAQRGSCKLRTAGGSNALTDDLFIKSDSKPKGTLEVGPPIQIDIEEE